MTQRGMISRAYAKGGLYVANETHVAASRDLALDQLADEL
jgi:hypothetical protein